MKVRLQPWQLAAIAVSLALVAVGAIYFARFRPLIGAAAMVSAMPTDGSTVAYLNVSELRSSGMLDLIAGSKAAEDLEYRGFVEGTGFDYRRDLDAVAASFPGDESYFLLSGRFNWQKLTNYAIAQGGVCHNTLCRIPSASTGRFTSFYPVRSNLLALAFSALDTAALNVNQPRGSTQVQVDGPIWVRVSPGSLRRTKLPSGTQAFTSPLMGAQEIVFSVAPKDSQLEIRVAVTCGGTSDASDLLVKLESATGTLRKFIEREHMQASPKDMSGLLTAGVFRREDKRVYGTWPLRKELIESFAAGGVN